MNELEQKIDCLEIKEQGIRLEYQYVNELKNEKINELEKELSEMEKENKTLIEEVYKIKSELEQIKNSRWWKLRNIIKKEK